ncbi:MAG: 3-hydroxyacyl-CoA dehydrogenase/enoyl-CoA hydratase family protein, partial [Pseudomonadota bacterium]
KKIAVIGSGIMGSNIAAHVANAGVPVVLLDITLEDQPNHNFLAETAIEKMLEANPAPFTDKKNSNLITPANLTDNLEMLSDVDWIIEVVLEDITVKTELFKKIDKYRHKNSIVSSNTSTFPIELLTKDMPESFKKDFMITHFFNPPRYMRLLELVTSEHSRAESVELITNFIDVKLGKGIVKCNDTAGFIANRIGCFWLTVAIKEAIKMGITIEEADAIMSKPLGIPKTGVFGLMDLIGIDLMPLIAKSFSNSLAENDRFLEVYSEEEIIENMIKEGYTGRKGKGGFYMLDKDENGKKTKLAKNLVNGEYAPAVKNISSLAINLARNDLRAMVEYDEKIAKYAKSVLVQLLEYTANLVPEISDDIQAIDEAMQLGYNWKYGPFKIIDKLSNDKNSGAAWLSKQISDLGRPVPQILQKIGDKKFYQDKDDKRQYFNINGNYQEHKIDNDSYMLAEKKIGKKPIKKNGSAALWDIGDGIACLEFTSKMNSIDFDILQLMTDSVELVKKDFRGLVIANDADNFCVGANIGMALFLANIGNWQMIDELIVKGQEANMGLKHAPFPVVSAVTGMALGGGCEILLHSDAVQAHIETYAGLVEVGVGVVPGWGGCKEMLIRHLYAKNQQKGLVALSRKFEWLKPVKWVNTMPAIKNVFMQIALAKVSKSAIEAQKMLLLNEHSRISMNRKRLLPDAKKLCLELSEYYELQEDYKLKLPGKSAKAALNMGINDFVKSGKATKYDEVVSKALAEILSGGDEADLSIEISEQDILALEKSVFLKLIRNNETLDRIEHMLETGKPLRN